MKKTIFVFAFLSLTLSACQQAPVAALRQNPASFQRANASLEKQLTPDSQDERYSFRRPVASLYMKFSYGSQRAQAEELVKEFMRKYVDQNDIVNYQFTHVDSSDPVGYVNIFGGNADFVKNRLLPDLKFYLSQRVQNINMYVQSSN